MVKILSVLLSATVLFILSSFFGPDAAINAVMKAPEQARPGEAITVTIDISKANLNGFGRIQVFIPQGITVQPGELEGAQFIFEENYVKFIWVQLPEEQNIRVSMKLHIDAKESGVKYLNGLFSYIRNDKTEKLDMKQVTVVLDPNFVPDGIATTPQPEVERKLIAVVPEYGEYRVELTIHPNLENHAARFVDEIPEGFVATVADAHGAEFTFASQSATFFWKTLPTDSVFTISYTVRSGNNHGAPSISGMLLYGDEVLTSTSGEATDASASTAETALADSIVDAYLAAENEKTSTSSDMNEVVASSTEDALIPAPQQGIYFKVQISATRKSPVRDTPWFQKNFKINENVDLTFHEGWKKYVIGSFTDLKDARAFRKSTSEKANGAFVVAYSNGERIPVKQALAQKRINQ